jgi:hypothetical protein
MFYENSHYTRKEVWKKFNQYKDFPKGGNWSTGYVSQGKYLIIFANINTIGRTGHNFPNTYDTSSEEMTWYGKPNAHSQQPLLRKLFQGILSPLVFARWDSKNTKFTYLGKPTIKNFDDNIKIDRNIETIRIVFNLKPSNSEGNPPPDGYHSGGIEGRKLKVIVNKFERDPALRSACLLHYGPICQVCGFDFEKFYGDLGKGYCHVHHIVPLSKIREEIEVNPITDLIPLCANCHSMIHRKSEVIHPNDLRKIIKR